MQQVKSLFILVAEDDTHTRLSLDVTLRRAGHQTMLMASGDALLFALDAMPAAESARIDLLVTDVNMPGTKGGELVSALDARGFCLPVVVITAYGTTALEDAFATRGAIRFLRKPFRPETLIDVIEQTYSSFTASCRDGDATKTEREEGSARERRNH